MKYSQKENYIPKAAYECFGKQPKNDFFIIWLYKKTQSKNTKQIWNIPKSIETMNWKKKKIWNYELKLKTNNNQSKYENWKLEPIIIKLKLKENSLEISLYLLAFSLLYRLLCFCVARILRSPSKSIEYTQNLCENFTPLSAL